ncbi:MAG: sigma-70 family RNA polymerase sigma factor [bacterium]|nr:sigma-70 family RNA polymerase sigma factor [bacterium]
MAFHTTRWSLIARLGGTDEDATRALDELCQIYWPAVYAMYRRENLDRAQALDLTQGLFTTLLARGDFETAVPERGQFRAFLRTCARNWLANERDRERAMKRGGGAQLLSLDVEDEEERLSREPVDHLDAAALFERRWAQAVIEQALVRLEAEEEQAGRGQVFALVRTSLAGDVPTRPWAELADDLGTTEGALRVAAHRLRRRFREQIEFEVRDTLTEFGGEGEELAQLMAALQA